MTAGPLEQILELVAEGRLTADEAAPILAALDETAARAGTGDAPTGGTAGSGSGTTGGAGSLRLEIRERGRQVVNLRLPVAVGRYALDRVPGLSGDQVDRVREALSTGMRGPVLEVDDGDNTVLIILE
jgi:SHOCT-like domain